MYILIEGESYDTEDLNKILPDSSFYRQESDKCYITKVGYYHSTKTNKVVYLLPKVFKKNKDISIFGLTAKQLFCIEDPSLNNYLKNNFSLQHCLVLFYKSLVFYIKRTNTEMVPECSYNFRSHRGKQEYTYLDLMLSFVNFYKRNQDNLFLKKEFIKSREPKTVSWSKTLRKSKVWHLNKKNIIYTTYINKKRFSDLNDILLVYFYSILNEFKESHNLSIKIDSSIPILKDREFEREKKVALTKLRRKKNNYFSDRLKKIYNLCEMYFSNSSTGMIGKKNDEFISISNYNIVFEDMVDFLFTEENEYSALDHDELQLLKKNEDGKVIDHIFEHGSLIDRSNIFYIGDSKYYKPESSAHGGVSMHKQFTYAKNIVQYNINLLNQNKPFKGMLYRDSQTEGYNITPNFFIYGVIEDLTDFTSPNLNNKREVSKSSHFDDRLFDRDTLYVHHFNINFLYVLNMYSYRQGFFKDQFLVDSKSLFRETLISFFNNPLECGFNFFKYTGGQQTEFIDNAFKALHGKMIVNSENDLILALPNHESLDENIMREFEPINLE